MTDTSNLPLDGIRVIDFTRPSRVPLVLYSSLILVPMYQDRPPAVGDLSRHTVGGTSLEATNNPTYVAMNRNKRSMELDTKSEAGKKVIYELVKVSDVVVTTFARCDG